MWLSTAESLKKRTLILVDDGIIQSKRSLDHLVVNFTSYVEYASKKLSAVIAVVSRTLYNSSAVITSKRKLLAVVKLPNYLK